MAKMIVNVDTWGAGSNQMTRGQEVPDDCPGDIAWATEHRVIVPEDEYQQEHPEWRPPSAREAEQAAPVEGRPTPAPTPAPSSGSTETKPSGGRA
jgi:hypothetical protein